MTIGILGRDEGREDESDGPKDECEEVGEHDEGDNEDQMFI